MFDLLFRDSATVRRATGRDVRNAVTYEEVKGEDGGSLPLACKFNRRGRRIKTMAGIETQTDATMIYRTTDMPAVKEDDMVVIKGETYCVVAIEKQNLLASEVEYARADLSLDRTEVPEDVNAS